MSSHKRKPSALAQTVAKVRPANSSVATHSYLQGYYPLLTELLNEPLQAGLLLQLGEVIKQQVMLVEVQS